MAVIFASRSGNTRQVAQQIATTLNERGQAHLFPIDQAPADLSPFDLVVIGGPTEGHGMTPAVRSYLGRLDSGQIRSRAVAAFDTRLAWPRALSGSAAADIASDLRDRGGLLVAEPESFIVDRKPQLKPNELAHADVWARHLAQVVEPHVTPTRR